MEKACYGSPLGPEVTPTEFLQLASPEYKQRGVFPYCKACRKVVHPYGVFTPNIKITPRFDHPDLTGKDDPLDDCVYANRSFRFRGMQPGGFDEAHGRIIRT